MKYCVSGTRCLREKCPRNFYNKYGLRCFMYDSLEQLVYGSLPEIDKAKILIALEEILLKKGIE